MPATHEYVDGTVRISAFETTRTLGLGTDAFEGIDTTRLQTPMGTLVAGHVVHNQTTPRCRAGAIQAQLRPRLASSSREDPSGRPRIPPRRAEELTRPSAQIGGSRRKALSRERAKDDTVVIEKLDRTVERVSRSRVVLAPKPATVREVDAILRPILNAELDKDYPKSEEENRLDLTTPVPSKGPNKPVTPVLKETPKTPTPEVVEENEVPTEEFVIDDIISHMVNKSRRHQYANKGETLYRVRWYGFEADDDTWEPIKHLPRSKVLSYFRRKDLEIPEDINKAIDG